MLWHWSYCRRTLTKNSFSSNLKFLFLLTSIHESRKSLSTLSNAIYLMTLSRIIFCKETFTEAALQRCSYEKVFWKYAANLEENTHAEVYWNYTSACVFSCKFDFQICICVSLRKRFFTEHSRWLLL